MALGGAHLFFAAAQLGGQALVVVARQQLQRAALAAQGLGAGEVGVARALGQQGLQLQAQAFGQVARAYAGRFQGLQKFVGEGEAMHEFLHLFEVVVIVHEGGGQLGQRVFEVAVVVERFDEKAQHGHVFGREAQGQGLAVQVLGEGFVQAAALAGVQRLFATLAGGGFAAPFAVVGGDFGVAVAVPVGFAFAAAFCAAFAAAFTRFARFAAFAGGGVGVCEAEFFARGAVVGALEEGVFVQHGVHFALQIERGQLQQAYGLLQLGSEGQALRGAQ